MHTEVGRAAPAELQARSKGLAIGVLSPFLTGPFWGSLVSAIVRLVGAANGRVVAVQTALPGRFNNGAPIRPEPVGWELLDGFVAIAGAVPVDYLERLREAGKPVVTLSHQEPGFECPAVLADNHGGVFQAVEHLLEHGHQRIAFSGCTVHFDIQQRYAGYLDALAAHGIEPDPRLVFPSVSSMEPGGFQAGTAMVLAGLPCTAVVAATDLNAVGIMSALRSAGYRLPKDQAVVGFDDIPGAALLTPSLSTISQNVDNLGCKAAELLLRLLAGDDVAPGLHLVPASFIARESCGCLDRAPARTGQRSCEGPAARPGALGQVPVGGADGSAGSADEADQLAAELRQIYQEAALGVLSPARRHRIGEVCEELYARTPSQATYDAVLSLGRKLSSELSAGASEAVAGSLEQCTAEARVALTKALLNERNNAYYDLRRAVWDEYEITMDLLSHDQDPRSLGWLSRTTALAAVLALWPDPEQPGPLLTAVGTFHAPAGELVLPSACLPVGQFPPEELLELVDGNKLVSMFPVIGASGNWGFLALVEPIDQAFLTQDTHYMWASLFSEALDHEALMRGLRQRGEDLAESYERELEMAQAVRQSEERYALAAQAANDGLWDWDLVSGTIYYSARWKQMLGYSAGAIGDNPEEWLRRAHPDDRAELLAQLGALKAGERGFILNEHRVRTSDGTYKWALCRGLAVPGPGGPATRMVGSLTDITERRLLEEGLRHQALHDDLTGLPNRALFIDRLAQAIATSRRRRKYSYAVLWLDLDGFKVLNDSLGHVFGDKLLVQVAERVRSHVRETDAAARFGGDEFALLLQDVGSLASTEAVARRLLEHLKEPYSLDGHQVVVTACLGIAAGTTGYKRPEDVLRDADIAMYKAKALGPGSLATFDSPMYATAMSRMKTETELRQAIELGQLELHYQPIVELGTGRLASLESLVRWRHPNAGLVPPMQFLPVAEESGLIVPMGRWVQAEACRQLAQWRSGSVLGPSARVAINASNREFWDPRLVDQLDQVLIETGVNPGRLTLEITEGVIMDNLERALEVLQQLHARGIHIHIDDFGTGYSSLQALHLLPIDVLKIDKSFVTGMTEQDRTLELVRTILSLAKNIGVGVIAEGVETPVQRDMLADLGCPWGQGFLFSRALPAGELEDLLAGGPLLGPSGDATERPGSWARQLALWPVGSPDMPLGPPDELPDGLAASPVRWYKRSAGELATVTGSAS